jgi:bacteriocin biosynthesis cyclodehydratase domain-containing protein
MVLKLDPRATMVWRDPFSLQFGVDPARAVLREVSSSEERMIAALASGVSRSGLTMIAQSSGSDERVIENLIARVDALLVDDEEPQIQKVVNIAGTGPTVDRIAETLVQSGVLVRVSVRASTEPCDLGLAVGHYVLDPDSYGFWLRRDLPHLPIIFGDETVAIGPLVEPGVTACLYCLEHHRRDADASWSAIASQLWGRVSASETPLVSREVAAIASRIIMTRLADKRVGVTVAAATSLRLSVDTGQSIRRDWMPHPGCGCIRLPGVETAGDTEALQLSEGRPENDSLDGWAQPRRVAAVDAPE